MGILHSGLTSILSWKFVIKEFCHQCLLRFCNIEENMLSISSYWTNTDFILQLLLAYYFYFLLDFFFLWIVIDSIVKSYRKCDLLLEQGFVFVFTVIMSFLIRSTINILEGPRKSCENSLPTYPLPRFLMCVLLSSPQLITL